VSDSLYLRKNTAGWDRAIRFVIAAVFALGAPAVLRGPYWISLLGVVAGLQLVAAATGY
jgi:hypothetical protein